MNKSIIAVAIIAVAILSINVAYAQTEAVDQFTQLILAISGLVGAIATLAGVIIAEMKKRGIGDKEILDNALKSIAIVLQNAKATDKWIVENNEKIKGIVESIDAVIGSLDPQTQKKFREELKKRSADASNLAREIEESRLAVESLYERLVNIINALPDTYNKEALLKEAKKVIDES